MPRTRDRRPRRARRGPARAQRRRRRPSPRLVGELDDGRRRLGGRADGHARLASAEGAPARRRAPRPNRRRTTRRRRRSCSAVSRRCFLSPLPPGDRATARDASLRPPPAPRLFLTAHARSVVAASSQLKREYRAAYDRMGRRRRRAPPAQYLTAQKEQRLQELVASFKRWYDGQFGGPGGVDDALSPAPTQREPAEMIKMRTGNAHLAGSADGSQAEDHPLLPVTSTRRVFAYGAQEISPHSSR